jgi:hypothetical protein
MWSEDAALSLWADFSVFLQEQIKDIIVILLIACVM